MASTRDAVRKRDEQLDVQNKQRLLEIAAKLPFYNTSEQDFTTIAADTPNAAKNLRDYINGFSPDVRRILARFDLDNEITRLASAKILSIRSSAGSPGCATSTSSPATTWATSSST